MLSQQPTFMFVFDPCGHYSSTDKRDSHPFVTNVEGGQPSQTCMLASGRSAHRRDCRFNTSVGQELILAGSTSAILLHRSGGHSTDER